MSRAREQAVSSEKHVAELPPDIPLQSPGPHAYAPAALLLGSGAQFMQRGSQQIPGRLRGEARDGDLAVRTRRQGKRNPAEGTPSLLQRPQPELRSEWGRRGGAALSHLTDSVNAGRLRRASHTHRAAMLASATASLRPH